MKALVSTVVVLGTTWAGPAMAAAKPKPKPTTTVKPKCHPSYSPCVPIASDVDCAGGSGDGPVYVRGPVKVIGPDVYRLDADHDGLGCE